MAIFFLIFEPSVTPLKIAQSPEDRALQVREVSLEAAKRKRGRRWPPWRCRVWRQAAGITDGPLFRRISTSGAVGEAGLSDKTVVRLIKRTARAAGLNETRY